jgi:hypothetical protein
LMIFWSDLHAGLPRQSSLSCRSRMKGGRNSFNRPDRTGSPLPAAGAMVNVSKERRARLVPTKSDEGGSGAPYQQMFFGRITRRDGGWRFREARQDATIRQLAFSNHHLTRDGFVANKNNIYTYLRL